MSSTTGSAFFGNALLASTHESATAVEAAEQAAAEAAEARVAVPQSLTAPEGEAEGRIGAAAEGRIGAVRMAVAAAAEAGTATARALMTAPRFDDGATLSRAVSGLHSRTRTP